LSVCKRAMLSKKCLLHSALAGRDFVRMTARAVSPFEELSTAYRTGRRRRRRRRRRRCKETELLQEMGVDSGVWDR